MTAKGNIMENQIETTPAAVTPVAEGHTRIKFSFRKPTETAIANAAKEGRPTPIHRQAVDVDVKLLTVEDLAAILTGSDEKAKELLTAQANQVVTDAVRAQLDDQDTHVEIDVAKLDLAKADFAYIANLPPLQRTGGGIPTETWDAWVADYVATLVRVADKTEQVATNSANIFRTNLKEYRFSPEWLKALQGNLQTWFTSSTEAAEFSAIYERLNGRVEGYLKDATAVASGLI